MLEELMKELKTTREPFMDMLTRNENFVLSIQKPINDRIKYWETFSKITPRGTFEQEVANYIILNETMMNTAWTTMHVYEIFMARHIYCTEWAVSILDIMLKSQESAATSKSDKEIIAKLQTELGEIKKMAADNQQYIDAMKEGIERKQKWLNENR
jgi:hypothetical protein